jgi:hypothetical protein
MDCPLRHPPTTDLVVVHGGLAVAHHTLIGILKEVAVPIAVDTEAAPNKSIGNRACGERRVASEAVVPYGMVCVTDGLNNVV